MPKRRADARSLVAEIVRRHAGSQVIRVSNPPTTSERLQLIAARLTRTPIVIMPQPCATTQEWLARYGALRDR